MDDVTEGWIRARDPDVQPADAEAMLDVLSLQCQRDRFSDLDSSSADLDSVLSSCSDLDLESIVHDLAIDNSIAECFASSSQETAVASPSQALVTHKKKDDRPLTSPPSHKVKAKVKERRVKAEVKLSPRKSRSIVDSILCRNTSSPPTDSEMDGAHARLVSGGDDKEADDLDLIRTSDEILAACRATSDDGVGWGPAPSARFSGMTWPSQRADERRKDAVVDVETRSRSTISRTDHFDLGKKASGGSARSPGRTVPDLQQALRLDETLDDVTLDDGIPSPVAFPSPVHTLERSTRKHGAGIASHAPAVDTGRSAHASNPAGGWTRRAATDKSGTTVVLVHRDALDDKDTSLASSVSRDMGANSRLHGDRHPVHVKHKENVGEGRGDDVTAPTTQPTSSKDSRRHEEQGKAARLPRPSVDDLCAKLDALVMGTGEYFVPRSSSLDSMSGSNQAPHKANSFFQAESTRQPHVTTQKSTSEDWGKTPSRATSIAEERWEEISRTGNVSHANAVLDASSPPSAREITAGSAITPCPSCESPPHACACDVSKESGAISRKSGRSVHFRAPDSVLHFHEDGPLVSSLALAEDAGAGLGAEASSDGFAIHSDCQYPSDPCGSAQKPHPPPSGHQVHGSDLTKDTYFDIAAQKSQRLAVNSAAEEAVTSHPAEISHHGDVTGRIFGNLLQAARSGDVGAMTEEATKLGEGGVVSLRDARGDNLLHACVACDDARSCSFVARLHPGLLHKTNFRGMTPLEMAVQGGKSACVEALTAHFLSAAEGRLEVLTSCLKMATIHGQVSVLEPLLTCRDKMTGGPRDVIVSDRGDTLAHLAAKQAHVNVLQLLAAKGYDVTKRNKDGAAAIDVSRAVRSLTCFRFLLPFHVSTSVLRHSVSMATTNQRLLSTQDAVMKDLETIQKEIEAASSTNHRQASTQRQRLTECRKVLASSLEMTSSSDRHGVLGDVRRDLHYCLQLLEEVESQQPMGSLDRLAAQWGQDLGELVEELRLAKTFPHEKTDGVDGRVFSHVLRSVSKMRDWQEKSLDDVTHLVVMDTALSLSNVTSPGKTAGSNGRSTGNESDGDSSTSTLKAGGMRSGWQHESDSESTVVALDRLRMRKRRRFRDDVSSSERSAATVADSEDWLLGGQSELSGSSRTVTSYSEESSYYSDEDDVSDHVVRLNLQNEDAEQDDLRIQRLEKHLDDIQRLNAASSDVIETIVTATGERIPGTSAVTGRRQNSRQPDGNRAGRGQAAAGADSSKPTKTPGKFFKAREAPKPRELTPSEFMECFDRTGDVTILHRRQQELDLPWQELHFSDAEDDKPEKPWYEISEDEEGLQERRSGTSGHSSDDC